MIVRYFKSLCRKINGKAYRNISKEAKQSRSCCSHIESKVKEIFLTHLHKAGCATLSNSETYSIGLGRTFHDRPLAQEEY
jgi:hypothetical protein